MKSILSLLLFLFLKAGLSQNNLAIKYYDQAVSYFNQQKYKVADSLFTLSNNFEPHKDTYYSRAICRLKMKNKDGYCMDLLSANIMGDIESDKLFWRDCGTIDTTYFDANSKPCNKSQYTYKEIKYKSSYSKMDTIVTYYKNGNVKQYKSPNNDSIAASVQESAEFPGGITALADFIRKNLRYPTQARENGVNGKVFLKFVISEEGKLSDIKTEKGIPNCKECETEAIRIISIMPNWKPAKINGKPVKCYFNFPIKFSVR
jgi:TonB family protein